MTIEIIIDKVRPMYHTLKKESNKIKLCQGAGMHTLNDRKKLFSDIRKALKLFDEEKFTQSFNLLNSVERKTTHMHLISKIANIKIRCLIQVGNVLAAKEYLETLLTKYPVSGKITFMAANTYHKLEELEKANRLYLRCVCLYPDNTQYALIFAQFLREMNRPNETLGILKKCLRKNRLKTPRDHAGLHFLYLELGLTYYYANQYWRALILLGHTAAISQQFPYNDIIAEILLKRKDYEKANQYISLHLQDWTENDPEALYLQAKIFVALNRRKEAFQSLEKCEKLWGELVITAGDMTHLFPLMQDGSLKKLSNLVIEM